MSDWIGTYTGKKFYPLDPRIEDIDILDIAHALSNVCRFTGHVNMFYSVAQHSVLAARYAPGHLMLAALLHDASEAYLCDLSRPVKHDPEMHAYRAAEKRLMRVIEHKFNVVCDHPTIHEIDTRLLLTEKRDLMPTSPDWGVRWGTLEPYAERIVPWTPGRASREFIDTFINLQQLVAPTAA